MVSIPIFVRMEMEKTMENKENILYHLSAADLLKILGYTTPQTEHVIPIIEKFESQYQKSIPPILKEYMKLAMDNPLLRTSDIWTSSKHTDSPFWTFLYDSIEEMNQEDEEVYPEFAHLPREAWNNITEDYFEIGSDYAAGVVTFGIRTDDMPKEDPPVYMQHEADEITEWNLIYQTLSDYLLAVTCDALFGWEYRTSQIELEKNGWLYTSSEVLEENENILSKYQIDLSKLHKIQSIYYGDTDERIACCYHKKENKLFLIQIKDKKQKKFKIIVIKKEK